MLEVDYLSKPIYKLLLPQYVEFHFELVFKIKTLVHWNDALNYYWTTAPVNEVGYVDAVKPLPKGKEELTDELSTQPGLEVTVRPDGSIKIKKKPDPNWDDMRDENLSDASDEDEEEESGDDAQEGKKKKEAKPEKNGKQKKEAKKRSLENGEKQTNGKKKKNEKIEEESDDEEMDEAEQNYLKRQQETETEVEEKGKKEAKVDKKKKDQVCAL